MVWGKITLPRLQVDHHLYSWLSPPITPCNNEVCDETLIKLEETEKKCQNNEMGMNLLSLCLQGGFFQLNVG
jgi:hypothetical protein